MEEEKAHRELTKNDKLAEVKGMNLGYVCLIVLFTAFRGRPPNVSLESYSAMGKDFSSEEKA